MLRKEKTMKRFSLFVLACLVVLFTSSFVYAVDKHLTFSWQYDNPPAELAGFKLHIGVTSGTYDASKDVTLPINDPALNQNCTPAEGQNFCYVYTLPVPDTGVYTYYFAATAYDTSDRSSDYSNEVNTSYDFEVPPAVSDLSATFDAATSTLSFKWTYETTWLGKIEKWSLWESETAGSNYTKVVDIPYDPNATPPYGTDVAVSVPEGSKVTKYYVLVTHRPSANNYAFSSNSNEVSVTINKMPPKSPFEFKIKVRD